MTQPQDPEREADPELARVLREWTVPALPDSLDARVKDLFRRRAPRLPPWRRFLTASVRVPLPVALAILVALLLAVIRRSPARPPERESVESAAPIRAAQHQTPPGVAGGLAGFDLVREMKVKVLPEPERND